MARLPAKILAALGAIGLLALPVFALTGESNPQLASSNWAGYFLAPSTYSSIGGQWTMPVQSLPNRGSSYGALSIWIGLQHSPYLIQGGTAQVNGSQLTTYLFWENYPSTLPQDALPGTLGETQPGDRIASFVQADPNGAWTLWIEDLTSKRLLHTTIQQRLSRQSLQPEWMVEDSGDSGSPLLSFSAIQFSNLTVDGRPVNLNRDQAESESMAQGESAYATVSPPSAGGNRFAVGYESSVPQLKSRRQADRAAIDVVAPLRMTRNRTLLILGGGFGPARGWVWLNAVPIRVLTWHRGEIRATVPASFHAQDARVSIQVFHGPRIRFDGRLTVHAP